MGRLRSAMFCQHGMITRAEPAVFPGMLQDNATNADRSWSWYYLYFTDLEKSSSTHA
jgi:hypothetical protein